jgi:hypothetical protein
MSTQTQHADAIEKSLKRLSKAAKACSGPVKDKTKQGIALTNLTEALKDFQRLVPHSMQDANGGCPAGTQPCGDYCCNR